MRLKRTSARNGSEAPSRISDRGELVNLRCSALVLRNLSVLLCRREDDGIWVLPGGTPKRGEGTAAASQREVLEETGLSIISSNVAFVLETTSRDLSHHLIEIVFLGVESRGEVAPQQGEPGLFPEFVPLGNLGSLAMRPPISGYIRGFARYQRGASNGRGLYTASYLGNLWRATDDSAYELRH